MADAAPFMQLCLAVSNAIGRQPVLDIYQLSKVLLVVCTDFGCQVGEVLVGSVRVG